MEIRNLADFDDPAHRIESASAAFQKGIYHLFMLVQRPSVDIYASVLRTYQGLFELLLTQLLLDSDFRLSSLGISGRLRRLCKDPDRPSRSDIDPGALVTHTTFEEHKEHKKHCWDGFRAGHRLEGICRQSFELYDRVVDARHNLLYRPFLLERDGSWHWEDCTLDDLVPKLPDGGQLEQTYKQFGMAITDWARHENMGDRPPGELPSANIFLASLLRSYDDLRRRRPTMPLLPSYASLLNPGDGDIAASVREYALRTLPIIKT